MALQRQSCEGNLPFALFSAKCKASYYCTLFSNINLDSWFWLLSNIYEFRFRLAVHVDLCCHTMTWFAHFFPFRFALQFLLGTTYIALQINLVHNHQFCIIYNVLCVFLLCAACTEKLCSFILQWFLEKLQVDQLLYYFVRVCCSHVKIELAPTN